MAEITPGTILSRYRIISKLGAGGMGEVYLAEDAKLDRKFALKILPEGVAVEGDRMRRFVQEAKAASALNHPNIITIYEIGETGNRHFIAAEFVTLKALANFSPGFALKPWDHASHFFEDATLKELRQVWRLASGDATLSGLRVSFNRMRFPRVAKAQPWAGISERLQRSSLAFSVHH